jgi:SAM-dependent methyltransferase
MQAAESSLQEKSEQISEKIFLGGPKGDFERVGRLCFEVLLKEGLRPSSRVLDVGCGALRAGYWLMRFLDTECYFGIEPNRDMLEVGLEQIVQPEVVARAGAHFAHNDDFDFSVFDEQFDFVLARSIWTHTSKAQIRAMLGSFAATAAPGGALLASYHPASGLAPLAQRWPRIKRLFTTPLAQMSPILVKLPAIGSSRGYEGEQWVGISHQSDAPGVVRHSLRWISEEARQHELRVQLMAYPVTNAQYWLRVKRAPGTNA